MAAGFLFWPYNPDLVRRMAKVADRPLAAFDGAICMVPRRSALAKGRAAARGAGVFTAPMFSVIEYDNTLELRPRVKTSGWPPAVVQVPLDLDPSEKWSERALCADSGRSSRAIDRLSHCCLFVRWGFCSGPAIAGALGDRSRGHRSTLS